MTLAVYKPILTHRLSLSLTTMTNPNEHPEEHPRGRTPNVFIPTLLDEVRGFTIDDLPRNVDAFLEPLDLPLPGDVHVYVVWRGRVPGLYYRWLVPSLL